jgi:drug/metabolite transporter (DMT)-like permease
LPADALALALAAASLHALWNLLLARADDPEAATAVVLPLSVLLFAPIAALTWDVEAAALPYVAGSAAFELAYFALLAAAYRGGELSVLYPVARGAAPVLVLVVAVALLGAAASGLEVAGVLLVAAGVLLVRGLRSRASERDLALAGAIAACIAGYTLIDNEGVRHASPLPYLELVLAPVALVYGTTMLQVKGALAVRAALGGSALAISLAGFGAYALVLAALELASAAPVAAVRESSVVIATALAALVLHERVSVERVAGAALVTLGIVALALG